MALITAAQVREHYPALQGTGEDARLATMIARANELMAAYCGFPRPAGGGSRTLEAAEYVSYLDSPRLDDERILDLPVYPVISVESVHVDAAWDYDSSTLVDSAEYELVAETGELYLRGSSTIAWVTSSRAQRVAYTAGFATTPPALVALAATAVRALLDGGHAPGITSLSVAGQSSTREPVSSLLPPAVRAGLDAGYTLWGARVG